MAEMDETSYEEGFHRAWLQMLGECLRHLDVHDPDHQRAAWVLERQEVISILRQVCATHGDNDWMPDEHLADVIEKHLYRHLVKNDPHGR